MNTRGSWWTSFHARNKMVVKWSSVLFYNKADKIVTTFWHKISWKSTLRLFNTLSQPNFHSQAVFTIFWKKMNLFHRNKVNSHETFYLDVLATLRCSFLDNLRLHWVTWPRWSCDRRLIDQRGRDHVASVVVETRWCCRNVESKSFILFLWKKFSVCKMDPETINLSTRTLFTFSKCWSRLNWAGAAYLLRVWCNCWTRRLKILQHSLNNIINAYFAFPRHDRMAKQMFFSVLSFVNFWL